jgi:hypothetical protein
VARWALEQHKSHVFAENQPQAIHFITVLTELGDLNPLSLGNGSLLLLLLCKVHIFVQLGI